MSNSAMLATRPMPTKVRAGHEGFFTYHGFWAPGVRLFRQMRFMSKALVISLAFVLPLLAMLGFQISNQYLKTMRDRETATRQHVEIAHGLLVWAQAQEQAGKLSREQAQELARDSVSRLRYEREEYFWINDMQPRVVMHPIKPELNGQDVSDLKDPNGLRLFQAFVAKVRADGKGFVAYQWPKPGESRPVDKISYVMGFEPWGWVIGSGIYVNDVQNELRQQVLLDAGVTLFALLFAAYLFFCFYRVMDGGLRETRRHLRAMTSGDLTTTPSPWGRDEAAQLMIELRHMQDSLRDMVVQVRHASDEIVRSSTESAHGATDLSARTEQAAASLEESAASMEQISATVKTTQSHTEEASGEARHNAEAAVQGGRIMQEVVSTMERIRQSSAQIAEIIGTIDGIAFQTNILALNAAVEAARAGEQGKGFAVVAGEVRMLAQRSAEAAREIKALIGGSVEQVSIGASVVQRAGTTIEEIVASARRVSELLASIAISAREERVGIGQVGEAIQELDRMTQQNAALVQETVGTANTLNDQARYLADQVARFRLPA
ncbi:methyl-accepting chemotaxis protein [Rhodoferax sp. BAB1]|uniref:methyl-accepting chemotaxis protein n=1 Tax=Rhodoferax sp. BAB1 TaxID=2741720 RepID=UPI0020C69F46|nr:methyl-accepting chemotaxis protein [Rhodoferax sp. BAB1]